MKTWTDIGSDVNWEDYGGRWAKADPTYSGRYYVIEFTNMWDACGEDECVRDGQDKYICEVRQVDLTEIPKSELESALECVGLDPDDYLAKGCTPNPFVLVEACASYGVYAPMESFSANVYAARVRAQARRYADRLMSDDALVEEHLDKTVNKIGSTARDFGQGDSLAGLARYAKGVGEPSRTGDLMLKMYGRADLARVKETEDKE